MQSVRRFPIQLMKQEGKQVVYRKSSTNKGDFHKEQPVQNKYLHSLVTFQKVQKSTISSGNISMHKARTYCKYICILKYSNDFSDINAS